MALSAIRGAREASTPTLVVLDDVDVAGPQVAEELQSSLEVLSGHPVLVLGLLRDRGSRRGSRSVDRARRRTRRRPPCLAPLDIDGVRGIVRLYVGQDETTRPWSPWLAPRTGSPVGFTRS